MSRIGGGGLERERREMTRKPRKKTQTRESKPEFCVMAGRGNVKVQGVWEMGRNRGRDYRGSVEQEEGDVNTCCT